MTIIEGERLAGILMDAWIDGRDLVVELTGEEVLLTCSWSERHRTAFPWEGRTTGHLHRSAEITIKGVKRGDLL